MIIENELSFRDVVECCWIFSERLMAVTCDEVWRMYWLIDDVLDDGERE